VAAFGLAVIAAVLAVLAAVAMILGRGWLEQRVLWGVGLVAVSLVAVWWRPRGEDAVWATVLMVVGGLVVATDLGSASDHDFDNRVLADDLPPVAVYVAALGLGLSVVAWGAVAGLTLRAGPIGSRRRAATVAGISGVAAAALVAAVVPAGTAIRSVADRRAEADDLTISVSTAAERRDEAPGPARPAREVWSVETPPDADRSVAVPGWDLVLVMSTGRPFWLTAVSKADGEELWTYRRARTGRVSVTVDPDAGRILLTDGSAAVVLDLADASELVTRRLSHPEGCRLDQLHFLEVSALAPLVCRDRDGNRRVVDVSSGRSLASTDPLREEDRPRGDRHCVDTVAPGAAPVVVQAGGGDCRVPELLAYDPSSDDFGTPATVELPPAWSDLRGPLPAFTSRVEFDPIVTDDLVVLSLVWLVDDDDPDAIAVPQDDEVVSEVVALNRDGDVLWRRPGAAKMLAVTGQGVLARMPDEWALLSLADGAVVARDSQLEQEEWFTGLDSATTDGERLYSLTWDGSDWSDLVVRDLADLTVQEVRQDFAPQATTRMHATDGRLIFQTDDASLVAYEDAQGP
jgi:hypothetical protein